MRLLLIHQNFPGQFRDLAPALLDRGHELKAIGCNERPTDPRMQVFRYIWNKQTPNETHKLTPEVDEWIRRGEAVARICEELKQQGWAPDVLLVHPGWGEALFIKDVFDTVPMVIWPELWLRPEHFGSESEAVLPFEQRLYQRTKNWIMETALAQCDAAILPTTYQAQTFPTQWQSKIQVIHEGIRDELTRLTRLQELTLSERATLRPETPVVSYASRNLEPMRGYEQFLRALSVAQKELPSLHAVIAGSEGSSYSGDAPGGNKSWKQVAEERVGSNLDYKRIHYVGALNYDDLIKLFRRTDVHCYLSRSFVLSWSVLEAIACGANIVSDDNRMNRELSISGGNINYADRNSPDALGITIAQVAKHSRQNGYPKKTLSASLLSSECSSRLEELLETLSRGRF